MFMLKYRQLPESDENIRRVKEYLSRMEVKCRIDTLTYTIGASIKPTNVLIGASREEIVKDFDVVHTPAIRALFEGLYTCGIIFPQLVVLNNIKTIYINRLQLNRHDLYRTFTDNDTHWLSFIKLPNEMSEEQKNTTMSAIGVTVVEIFDYVLYQKNQSFKFRYDILSGDTFCNLVDEAIDQLKYDISFELSVAEWRQLVHSVKSYLVSLQLGMESPEEIQITATFVAWSLKNANGIYDLASIKNYIEASSVLELVTREPEQCTVINVGLEGVDVKGPEELVFYSDGAEDIVEGENLKNLARAVVSSFKAYSDDHKQMEEIFDNEQFVGFENLEEYAEKFQKIIELIQRHSGVIFGSVIVLLIAFLGYILKKKFDERGTAAEESVKRYNTILSEIESKIGGPADFIKYGIICTSKDMPGAFNNKFSTPLDRAILHGESGYDLQGIINTLGAHISAVGKCSEDMGNLFTAIEDSTKNLSDAHLTSQHVTRIRNIFVDDNFHLIPYTRKYLYDYVANNQGHHPWSTPTNDVLVRVTPDIQFVFNKNLDNFWDGRYMNGASVAPHIKSDVHVYSNLVKVSNVDHYAHEAAHKMLSIYSKENMSKLHKLVSEVTKLKSTFTASNATLLTGMSKLSVVDDQTLKLAWPVDKVGQEPTGKTSDIGYNPANVVANILQSNILSSRLHIVSQIAHSVTDINGVISRIKEIIIQAENYNNTRLNEIKLLAKKMKEHGAL